MLQQFLLLQFRISFSDTVFIVNWIILVQIALCTIFATVCMGLETCLYNQQRVKRKLVDQNFNVYYNSHIVCRQKKKM